MNSAITIKEASETDLPVLQKELPKSHHQQHIQFQKAEKGVYLIAWIDQKPVGQLFLYWKIPVASEIAERFPNCPVLGSIEVKPEFQSHGIGTALIEKAQQLVKEKGYHQVGLSVAVENTHARRLYEKLGFEDTNIEEHLIPWHTNKVNDHTSLVCDFLMKQL